MIFGRRNTNARAVRPVRSAQSAQAGSPGAPGRWRVWVCVGIFLAGWVALWGRAAYVQLVWGPELAELARRQHQTAEVVRGKRGDILDRNGLVIATSVQVESVCARPSQVPDPAATATALSKALGVPRKDLLARLTSRRPFVWLARQVDDKSAAQVRELKLKGVQLTTEYARVYPNGHLAGHLMGFVGLDGEGLEGLEKSFDSRLAGRAMEVEVQKDASGRRLALDERGNQLDLDGQPVKLSIDAQIQSEAESSLARAVDQHRAAWGACLVVKVDTGEVLAWAGYPYFNPNAFRGARPQQYRNHMALDIFEPGSTMKPLMVASALQAGIVKPEDVFNCEMGRWAVSGKKIRDTHDYGKLTVSEVVSLSSNIGAAKIGLMLGASRYHEYLTKLGFGGSTGLPLSAESQGTLRPAKRWYELDTANAAFGQGVGVTMAQMARAYLSLANDGLQASLRLDMPQPGELRQPAQRIFSPEVTRSVRTMLMNAVESGTGTLARIPGMRVGGKTGTAQKASRNGGYGDSYLASFIGLVPGDTPKYLVMTVIDDPKPAHYGGIVSAPVVREVAIKTLAYLGQLPEGYNPNVKPVMTAAAAAAAAESLGTSDWSPPAAAGPEAGGAVRREVAVAAPAGPLVPDLTGLSLPKAVERLARWGVMPKVNGKGRVVVRQSPMPGEDLESLKAKGVVLTLG